MEQYQQAKVTVQDGERLNTHKIRFSDDGRWLFVASGCRINVYSYSSRELVHILSHHREEVTSTMLHPRNRLQLLSSSLDGHLALWDYSDGALLNSIDFETPLLQFGIRPGGKEPLLFFRVEDNDQEDSDGCNQKIVGVSSHVITERQPAVSPGNQLAEAQHYLRLSSNTGDFIFSAEGSHVVTYTGKELQVCDINREKVYRYFSKHQFTALTSHPCKPCVATGNTYGEVQLWYDFGRDDCTVVTSTLHWHAHTVGDICFTSDGTYLLSGGEESVLVLWQLGVNKRDFRPRLGSPITRISCSPGDKLFTVSLQSNVVRLVSGLSSEVECTLGGLRKAFTQDPSENGLKTGLVLDPRSRSIVTNSTPGFIQFYIPEFSVVVDELDVVGLNYVSRPADKALTLTTIDHVAFSPDGMWLATVEGRDDGKLTPELRLKFWQFSTADQSYTLNTCVDPPHANKVTSLKFQTRKKKYKHASHSGGRIDSGGQSAMAVSTSMDGSFKTWVSRMSKWQNRGTTQGEVSWSCRSAGDFQTLPCLGSAFSQDGSLLALNFEKYTTVWDPYTHSIRATFNAPIHGDKFVHVDFGHNLSSQYLMAASLFHLSVWDLLPCSLLWCVKVQVDLLVSDPFGSVAAAFVPATPGSTTTHLYIFEPSSPTPLAVFGSVCLGRVVGGVFNPVEGRGRALDSCRSELLFVNAEQVMFALRTKDDTNKTGSEFTPPVIKESSHERTFLDVFGSTALEAWKVPSSTHTPASATNLGQSSVKQVFNAPPHVLPPLSSLCQAFLQTLLLPSKSSRSVDTGVEVMNDDLSDDEATHENTLKARETRSPVITESKSPLGAGVDVPRQAEPMDTDENELDVSQKFALLGNVGEYDWLVESFRHLHDV